MCGGASYTWENTYPAPQYRTQEYRKDRILFIHKVAARDHGSIGDDQKKESSQDDGMQKAYIRIFLSFGGRGIKRSRTRKAFVAGTTARGSGATQFER